MYFLRAALVGVLVAIGTGTVPAQQWVLYSPPGTNAEYGQSFSQVMFGASNTHQSRVQQIDGNYIGPTLFATANSIAWRTDESTFAGAVARTVQLEVRMGHGDLATFSNAFDANYVDTPVVVVPQTNVSLPNATYSPEVLDFAVEIPFAVPWAYNQADPFIWEVRVFSSTGGGGYTNDFFFSPPAFNHGQDHIDHAPGCTTPNGVFTAHTVSRSVPGFLELGFTVDNAPPSAAVTMLLGSVTFFAVPIPSLCAPLGTDGFMPLPIGAADASGWIPLNLASVPWTPGLSGLPFSAQAVALDLTQTSAIQAALSNATLSTLPRTDGVTGLQCMRTFSQTNANASTGSAPTVSAVPVRFGMM